MGEDCVTGKERQGIRECMTIVVDKGLIHLP